MRVWIVDGQREIREGIAGLIESSVTAARITGLFALGQQAVAALIRGESFDVAVVDIGLPDVRGTDLIRQLRSAHREAAIVAFTDRFDDEAVFSALRAGASGYLTKDTPAQDIVDAVRSAASGAAPFSPGIGRRVAASFWSSPVEQEAASTVLLTARERQVLDLICTGTSYRDIGLTLGIAMGTVQTHVKNVYGKIGVGSKLEAMRWTLECLPS